ncbi:GNAT family N-acetyltransferase [Pyxidicoccus fallax]|uniref:GNAT family N-acetyltransferase n=1 Tax=Pyxidicoccus fallax TaxID=394095 RepID=A0A848LA46_9BACT|nr:GNAT family N-acetyltransferase [Pyxidicoccus fallax]NMO15930.1 GNAT family N-acetyltransferase [Pyxidicoccus fallax]NPC79326.1 GNAT family N-acetyltransferase [Pyxidicoccus fallax]
MSASATAPESAPAPVTSPGPIEFRWVSSLQDIGREAWESCFPHDDVMQSFALHQATEAAGLEGVEFHYLVGRSARGVVAILPCFRFRTSLTTIAPAGVNKAVAAVRRLFPQFLYIHAFVIGTPIAICKDLLGLHPGLDGTARADVLRASCREVLARARELGLSLVFLKELTSSLMPSVRDALGEEFTFVESPATTYLYLGEPGKSTYRERLRKKYRSLMNNRMARAEAAGLRWELCTDFAPYAKQMHPLYLQVLDRSKIRFETLSVDFFEKLPAHLGDRAFAMLCFKDERLVAFELFLQDGAWMHPIYLGLDYGFRDEGALYFNCIYKIVEVLEARGRPVAQLGQTSYAVKASIGAVVDRLYLAVRHLNPVLNLLVKRFGAALFPPTQLPRSQRVFRDMKENDEGLARHGIHFERLDDGGDE